MSLSLFMAELTVRDWPAAVAWYRDVLGLPLERLDAAADFALFRAGAGRVALKAGEPRPAGVRLYFHVPDLSAELSRLVALGVPPDGDVVVSPEGYRRAFVRDPDGHRLGLFEWISG
jgi:catechol 2,3-dioxygenase-like lactoylglutathione lyase family enzyme